MVRGVADALAFLHERAFVHGHIRPSNIMAVGDQLKISSDCIQATGGSRGQKSELTNFEAPEAVTGPLSPPADVWSLGMTVVAALTQNTAGWDRSRPRDPAVPNSIPEPFRGIVRECLRVDPARRCTLEQVKGGLEGKTMTRPSPVPATPVSKPASVKPRVVAGVLLAVVVVATVLAMISLNQHKTGLRVTDSMSETAAPTPVAVPPSASVNVEKTNLPGAVVDRVMPDVSRSARNTIEGKVKVNVGVQVDSTGKVQEARLERAGPSKYFANAALTASRRWKFKPAESNGQPVSSKWSLRYRFGRNGTDVDPVETSP